MQNPNPKRKSFITKPRKKNHFLKKKEIVIKVIAAKQRPDVSFAQLGSDAKTTCIKIRLRLNSLKPELEM
jgi:hypothetical protein